MQNYQCLDVHLINLFIFKLFRYNPLKDAWDCHSKNWIMSGLNTHLLSNAENP